MLVNVLEALAKNNPEIAEALSEAKAEAESTPPLYVVYLQHPSHLDGEKVPLFYTTSEASAKGFVNLAEDTAIKEGCIHIETVPGYGFSDEGADLMELIEDITLGDMLNGCVQAATGDDTSKTTCDGTCNTPEQTT